MPPKIPVSVTAELKARVENFVEAMKACISQPASSGLNSSTVCRMAIEAHNGRIWAESEPGKGSRFLFRLPLAVKAD